MKQFCPEIVVTEELHNNKEVVNVFLDRKLEKAEQIDENGKSFGVFMHSLILSNYTEITITNGKSIELIGNENEKAIALFTLNKGFDKNLIDDLAPKVSELQIASDPELKPSVHSINEKYRVVAKGSPVDLMQRCTYVIIDSRVIKLTRKLTREINKAFWTMVAKGLMVYALAIKDLTDFRQKNLDEAASDMTFVALVGIGKT